MYKGFCGEKEDPKPPITLLNQTNTCDGYDYNIDIINDDEYSALQKESLMLFKAYCIFGFWEVYKKLLCILVEVNKTMYGNNEDIPEKLLDNFYTDSRIRDNVFAVVWNVFSVDEKDNVNKPSMNLSS
jgi:hypothetical protein